MTPDQWERIRVAVEARQPVTIYGVAYGPIEPTAETVTVPLADLLLVIGDARSNPYSEEAEACARIEALIPPDNAEKRPRS